MKWVVGVILFFLSFAAFAGHDGNGGIFVKVKGQWVQFDEAVEYLEQRYVGITELIESDCYGHANCKQSNFGLALKDELIQVNAIQPALYNTLVKNSELVDIRLVNQELAYIPKDLPDSEIDFKEYKKAAIYRAQDGRHGTIWVSIPVMNQAGQIAHGRLTSRQNQGHLMFHELLNVEYSATWSAQQISDYGVAILKAIYNRWDEMTLLTYLEKLNFDILQDGTLIDETKFALINKLKSLGILNEVPPFERLNDRTTYLKAVDTMISYKQGQIPMNTISDAQTYFDNLSAIFLAQNFLSFSNSNIGALLNSDLPSALKSSDFKRVMDLINISNPLSRLDGPVPTAIISNESQVRENCNRFVPSGWVCRKDLVYSLMSGNKHNEYGSKYKVEGLVATEGEQTEIHKDNVYWWGNRFKISYSGYYFEASGNSSRLVHVVLNMNCTVNKYGGLDGGCTNHNEAFLVDPKTGRDSKRVDDFARKISVDIFEHMADLTVPYNMIPVERP